jgi:hypothetical protein
MLVRYNDPEFSKRYDLTVADGSDPVASRRQVTANAWNAEYKDVRSGGPLTKYLVTDAHIIRMADLYAKVVS